MNTKKKTVDFILRSLILVVYVYSNFNLHDAYEIFIIYRVFDSIFNF